MRRKVVRQGVTPGEYASRIRYRQLTVFTLHRAATRHVDPGAVLVLHLQLVQKVGTRVDREAARCRFGGVIIVRPVTIGIFARPRRLARALRQTFLVHHASVAFDVGFVESYYYCRRVVLFGGQQIMFRNSERELKTMRVVTTIRCHCPGAWRQDDRYTTLIAAWFADTGRRCFPGWVAPFLYSGLNLYGISETWFCNMSRW